MKKIIFIFILVMFLSVPLFAQDRVIDNAGLMSAAEKDQLVKRAEHIAAAYNFNLIILTEKSIGGLDPIEYSWNYLDEKGLDGYEWDGCLLLQSTGERDYAITASGRGTKILNNTAYNRLQSRVVYYLKQDDYIKAYNAFMDIWEEYLVLDAKGRSYNFFTHNNLPLVLGSWIISLLIGLFVVRKWKLQMNTVRPKTEADMYIIPGSLIFTQKHDRFLYSTVTKTRRAKSSSSSGSSMSSGGRSSRGGKY